MNEFEVWLPAVFSGFGQPNTPSHSIVVNADWHYISQYGDLTFEITIGKEPFVHERRLVAVFARGYWTRVIRKEK